MRVFKFQSHFYKFDNESDAVKFLSVNPSAEEINQESIDSIFGQYAKWICPSNTDEEGFVDIQSIIDLDTMSNSMTV